MRIRDPFFLYPGSGMEKFGSGIRNKHPGSATLINNKNCYNILVINFFWFLEFSKLDGVSDRFDQNLTNMYEKSFPFLWKNMLQCGLLACDHFTCTCTFVVQVRVRERRGEKPESLDGECAGRRGLRVGQGREWQYYIFLPCLSHCVQICNFYLKVLANEKRGVLAVVSFDRSRFKLFSRKLSNKCVLAPSCERLKTAPRTLFLSFESNDCFPITV